MIAHFEDDVAVVTRDPDRGGRTARMTMDVAQTFLQHPKQCPLRLGRQSSQGQTGIQRHLDPATLRKPGGVFLHRAGQAQHVQRRWVQLVRQRREFALTLHDDRLAVGEEVVGGDIAASVALSHEVEVHRHGQQLLRGRIVQLAADPVSA